MNILKTIFEIALSDLVQPSAFVSMPVAEPGDIIPARCSCKGEPFGIVLGVAGNKLSACQGIRYSQYARNSVVHCKNLLFPNGITRSSDYKCPICGKRSFVQCKKCKKISCYDESGWFTCAYCGNQGFVFGRIHHTQGFSCEVYKGESISGNMNSARSSCSTCATTNQTVFQEHQETSKSKGEELWTTL